MQDPYQVESNRDRHWQHGRRLQ